MDIDELLKKRLEPKKNFAGAFATIDIIGSSSLEGTSQEISQTKGALRQLVDELCQSLPIARTEWMGDGTLIIADASQGCDDLVIFCDKLVSLLPFFNQARNRYNFLKHDIVHLRVVCHHAPAVYNTGDKGILTDPEVNLLCKYDREVEFPDHVVITDEVYRSLSPDLQSRLHSLEPNKYMGACFVLDGHRASTTIELDVHETELLRNWLLSSTRTGKYDEVYIFGYTNESLSEYIVPLPKIKVSVLARSWLEETQDEILHNRQYAPKKETLGKTGPIWAPWSKSRIIRSVAETFMSPQSARPFRNHFEIRFYEGPPWLKGALLKNSKNGNRIAFIGIYPFLPSQKHGGSPYQRDKWSGIWLSDDKVVKHFLLDAIESRFEQLWERSCSFDDLVKKHKLHPSTVIPVYEQVWCADQRPYLIVYPAQQQESRPFPHVTTEDLMACTILEHRLTSVGFAVDFEPMFGSALPERALLWDGHLVLICFRTWSEAIRNHLRDSKFPFSFELQNSGLLGQKRIPVIKHNTHKQLYKSPMDQLPSIGKDYCVVGKCDRPGKTGKAFIIAGLHGLGTWGGSEFLTSDHILVDLASEVKDSNFALLIQSSFLLPHRLESVIRVTSVEKF